MRRTSPAVIENTSTDDFLIYGDAGLGLARAAERRIAELEHDTRTPLTPYPLRVRRWLGTSLIGLGQHIAGAPGSIVVGG